MQKRPRISQEVTVEARVSLARTLQQLCAEKQGKSIPDEKPFEVQWDALLETKKQQVQQKLTSLVQQLDSLRSASVKRSVRPDDSSRAEPITTGDSTTAAGTQPTTGRIPGD